MLPSSPLVTRRRAPNAHQVAAPPDAVSVWAGLALLLCGVAGSGTIAVRRRRRRPARRRFAGIVQTE
jgi:hypothetical protein